jgi:hypothetical protein
VWVLLLLLLLLVVVVVVVVVVVDVGLHGLPQEHHGLLVSVLLPP